jgi:hypothetical protein
MTRARTKQLQSALTSQISGIEVSMSLRACKLNGNGSNMFVCLQIRFRSWFESFDEFGFAIISLTNFGLNLLLLMRGNINPILHGFQVSNVIFPNCTTMHALEFCTKSYGCFNFAYLFVSFFWTKHVLFIIWYDPSKVKFGFLCKMGNYPILRQQS